MEKQKEKKLFINPCRCGKRVGRVQDFGTVAFIRCRCGRQSPRCRSADEAVSKWNALNPPGATVLKPNSVTVSGDKFMDWMNRAERGEVNIAAMEAVENGVWRLSLYWPDQGPEDHTQPAPQQADLL